MKIVEISARSILVQSNLPDAKYVVNPYTGCQFGCLYCYATYTGRFVREPYSDWGSYVYVKTNAAEVLRKELETWLPTKQQDKVLISSVTDPYQGVEEKYGLTRQVLRVFVDRQYDKGVSILTKSPMVLRDADLIKCLPNANVGLTLTTTDNTLSRFLEVRAPSASQRLDALRRLNVENIPTYAFVGPLLPHFRYQPELLDQLFREIADAGVKEVYVEHINLPTYIKERLWSVLRNEPKEVQEAFRGADTAKHRQALSEIVNELAQKRNLKLLLGRAIYHQDSKPVTSTRGSDIHDVINQALSTGGVVRIGYEDANGNVTERVISPIEWSNFDERKICAFCHLRQDERHFVLNRIRYAEFALSANDFATHTASPPATLEQ